MNHDTLIIATRESPLAMQQASWVKNQLASVHPELTINLLGLTTRADNMLSISLSQVGGKGLFVKELEEALLAGHAHLAVHSMKDMPMDLPAGLGVSVICEREDVRDVFISNHYASLETLPKGACVGTSSLRRQSQLLSLRADLRLENIRGNVNTRLARLDAGEFDALILAAAGLKRLGLAHRITAYLSVEQMLPAVGQGALALECRDNDRLTQKRLSALNHAPSFACVTAERALCKQLGGGCQVPVAGYAQLQGEVVELQGMVGSVDGRRILHARAKAPVQDVERLGETVARDLLAQGAEDILREFHDF